MNYKTRLDFYRKQNLYNLDGLEELSKDELQELILQMQLKSVNTIKKCAIFFTVLTCISIGIALISILYMYTQGYFYYL